MLFFALVFEDTDDATPVYAFVLFLSANMMIKLFLRSEWKKISLSKNVKHTHTHFIKDLLFFELHEKLSLSTLSLFLSLSFQALFFSPNVNAKQQREHTT